jgi:hypothetical protein
MKGWPVRKKILAIYSLILMNFFGGFFLGVFVDDRIFFLAMAVVCLLAVIVARLRCDRCGSFVFRHRKQFAGLSWTVWGGNPLPKRCPHCGAALNGWA